MSQRIQPNPKRVLAQMMVGLTFRGRGAFSGCRRRMQASTWGRSCRCQLVELGPSYPGAGVTRPRTNEARSIVVGR